MQPAVDAVRSRARVFDELAEPITTTASHLEAMALRAACRLVVAKHRSEVPGTHRSGQRSFAAPSSASHSSDRQGRLGQERHRSVRVRQGLELVEALDPLHRIGGDGDRADGLLMALVTDVHDGVALAGPHLDLVVHLLDQWAHRVDDRSAPGPGRVHDLGRRAVGRQHERGTLGHLGDVLDEDHAQLARKRSTTTRLWTISW